MVSRNSMLEAFEAAPRKGFHGRTPGKTSIYCIICREVIWGPTEICKGRKRSKAYFLSEAQPETSQRRLMLIRDWRYYYRPMELASIWGKEPW